MADAFRGLTIRLGADARPLNSAINSIAKSAGVAQQQMNRLNKALKFNPGNTQALARMVDLAGDKAMHSARQVQTLRSALDQAAASSRELLANSRWSSWKGGIESVASSYREVYAATQKLRSEGTHLTAELQHIYDAAKRTAAVDMGISFKKADKYVKGLQRNLTLGGAAAERAKGKLVDLFSKIDENDGVFQKFGIGAGKVQELTEKFFALRSEFKRTDAELKALNKVEGFRAIESQMIAAKAELREAANEAARLKAQLYAYGGSDGISKAVMEASRLDSVMDSAIASAQEMKDAFKMLPSSMEAARERAKSLADAEDAIRQKLLATRDAIATIAGAEGFDKVRAATVNAALAVEKLQGEFAELKVEEMTAAAAAESASDKLKEIRRITFGNPTASAEKLREALKLVGIEGDEALEKPISTLRKLESESKDAAANLDRVRQAMNKVEGEMREMGAYKTFQDLNRDAIKLKSTLQTIDFNKSLFSKLGGIGQTFRQFGYGMYSTLTPALMMAGRYVIQAADDVDAAYRDMRKTVNGTEEQFEHLKDAAVEFSRSHVTTADQILEIEAIGGQLGIAAGDLEAFATTVSNLDIATNMDTEDIALSLAKLSNIMHFGQESYDNFADSLVRLGNNEPALESDIMKIATRFAGMSANVGMGTADMLAFATAATATGQKAEAAGGSMQRTIGRIEKAVASGGDALEGFASISGMSSEAFARTWEDVGNHGPARALQAFVEGLKNVKENGGSVTKALSDLKITGVRDIQLLEGLSNTTDVLSDSLKMANDAWNGMSTEMKDGAVEKAGDAAREAGRKSEGFSGELAKMKNNAAALAIELGEGAAPYVKYLGETFKDLTGKFKDLDPELKSTAIGFAGVLAASGPAAVGIGTLLSAVGHVHGVLGSASRVITGWASKIDPIGPKLTKTSKAASMFAKALNFVGTPKSLVAIGLAIGGVYAASKYLQKVQERVEVFRKSTEGLSETARRIKGSTDLMKSGFDGVQASVSFNSYTSGQYISDLNDMADAGAALYDSINGKLDSALSDASLAEAYGDKIGELAGKCYGSSEKLAELKWAVEQYNEVTGSNIGITDEFSGAINKSTEELEKNTAAFQANAMMKAYSEVYADATKSVADLEVKMRETSAGMQNAEKVAESYGQSMADWYNMSLDPSQSEEFFKMWESAPSEMQAAFNQYKEGITAVSGYADQLSAAKDAQEAARVAMVEATNEAKTAAAEEEAAARKAAEASTYYEQLGEKGKQAFSKLRSEAGFAKGEGQQFAQALHDAGITADELSTAGTGAFSGLLSQAKKVADDVPAQLAYVNDGLTLLNGFGFDEKHIKITDDGAVAMFEGKILDLNAMTFDGKEIEVSDDGSLSFVDEQTVMLEGSLKRLNDQHPTPKADLEDNVSSKVDAASDRLSRLDGKRAKTYIDTYETTYKQTVTKGKTATGAIFGGRGKIPLNAAGAINGIVNRAMLTNIGWVGEAGAEAVMHMKNAGGAVIPLSNRRYVRPFARAVASEMGGGTTQVVNKYYSVNGMTLAPGSDGARALEALYDAIRLEEAV